MLDDRIKRLATLIKSVIAIIALVPVVVILTGLVDIPPQLSTVIKMVSSITTIVGILCIFLLDRWITRMTNMTIVGIVLVLVVTGVAFIVSYMIFATGHVIKVGDTHYVLPLHPSENILRIMQYYNMDYVEALETSVQRDRLHDLMQKESWTSTLILIGLLVGAQLCIILGIVGAAWKLTSNFKEKRSGQVDQS